MSVTRIKAKHFKVISSSTVDICANKSGSSSGDLTLTTASGVFTGGAESNQVAAAVNITSTTSTTNAGVTFDVTGIGPDGVTEVSQTGITGPAGSATVTTTQKFTKVTKISRSGTITDVSSGFAASTSGIVFSGNTRVRGMHGVSSATAGALEFHNSTDDSGSILLVIDTPNQDDFLDPYIPDQGIHFDSNGCFVDLGTAVTSVTVFFDG